MNIFTFILLVSWYVGGFWLVLGELPWFEKHRISSIFNVESRWGKILIGLTLILFCSNQVYQFAIDPNTVWELTWDNFK